MLDPTRSARVIHPGAKGDSIALREATERNDQVLKDERWKPT